MPRINYQAVAPEGLKALIGVKTYIDASSIDKKLRHLVELRVSQINGCLFCCDMHSRELRADGEIQQRLDCLPAWHEATFYSDRERAALEWAESMTLISQTHVPDDVYERARQHFGERELVDLSVIVAMMNLWNRMSVSFRSLPQERKS